MLCRVNGVRLNVIDEGHGPPVVFVHGLGGTWRDWEPELDQLTDRYRVVVPEHRGHGRSDAGTEKLTVPLLARDVEALCRSLGVDRAAVVGLSLGGMVAQALALDAAPLVAALVVADSTPSVSEPARSLLLGSVPLVREGGMELVGRFLEQSPTTGGRDRAALARAWRDLGSNDPLVYADAIEALCGYDGWERLGSITQPTLVVRGADDTLVSGTDEEAVAAAIPGACFRTIDRAGHNCNLDQPEAFHRVLTEFLEGVGYGGGPGR